MAIGPPGQHSPIPTNGAYDLGQLKRKDGNKDRQKELADEQMRQAGLLCVCGQKITQGFQALGVWEGQVPTPQGPQAASVCVHQTFCSHACPAYLEVKGRGIGFHIPGPQGPILLLTPILCERELEPIKWMKP